MIQLSNCCGASLIENTDLCSDCKEHSTAVSESVYSDGFESELMWLDSSFEPKSVTYNGKEIK